MMELLPIEADILMQAVGRGEIFREPSRWFVIINKHGSAILPYSHVRQLLTWESEHRVMVEPDGLVKRC